MATKQIKRRARKTLEPARRKATTFRLEPRLQSNLSMLGEILKTPLNRLVNEAVAGYLEKRTVQVESDLQSILDRVKAARRADPHFESAIRAFADSEANLGSEDPAEGRTQPGRGPAQSLVHQMLHV
jgi:predicted transcriptional regulator